MTRHEVDSRRCSLAEVEVHLEPVDSDDVLAGSPDAGFTVLTTLQGPVEVGIWQMTEGTCRDTEVDEAFVVLSGSAVLTVHGRSPFRVGPGDFVRLNAGDRTVWNVEAPIEKLFISTKVE